MTVSLWFGSCSYWDLGKAPYVGHSVGNMNLNKVLKSWNHKKDSNSFKANVFLLLMRFQEWSQNS